MKDYSKLKWFLFIPLIGIAVIFFSIMSECRFRHNKLSVSFLFTAFISALIGGLVGELTLFLVDGAMIYENLFLVAIIFLFTHIGLFIWCLIVTRKRKKDEQVIKTESENQEGK